MPGIFSSQIARFALRAQVNADLVLRKVTLDGYRALLERSPVDTGRFRGNWRVGVNRVDLTTTPAPKARTVSLGSPMGADELEKFATAAGARFGDTVHITNSLPYAERLEAGYSRQAPPGGILRATFEDLRANLDRATEDIRP